MTLIEAAKLAKELDGVIADVEEVVDYLETRIVELRKKYKQTGLSEYLYRIRECERALEHLRSMKYVAND